MTSVLNSKDDAKPLLEQESFSLISKEKLLEIYAAMVKCQMIEQRAAELVAPGKLDNGLRGFAGRGCLAAAVGVDLEPGDVVSVPAGDWLPAFVKGMSLESLFLSIADVGRGDKGSRLAREARQKDILIAASEEQQRADVLGCVAGARSRKANSIVVVFLSSPFASFDKWKDVMTMAAQQRLPIIFVRHRDGSPSAEKQVPTRKTPNPEALIHGVPAIGVDAADAVAIYRVAFEAFSRARQGRGATLLECFADPLSGALETGTEEQTSQAADPVLVMERYLRRKGIDPGHRQHHLEEDFRRIMELATRFPGR